MSWCRPVLFSNAASAVVPRCPVKAPGATPQSTPQVGTSFSPVRHGPAAGAGRGPPSAAAGMRGWTAGGRGVADAAVDVGDDGIAGRPGNGRRPGPGTSMWGAAGVAGAETSGSAAYGTPICSSPPVQAQARV